MRMCIWARKGMGDVRTPFHSLVRLVNGEVVARLMVWHMHSCAALPVVVAGFGVHVAACMGRLLLVAPILVPHSCCLVELVQVVEIIKKSSLCPHRSKLDRDSCQICPLLLTLGTWERAFHFDYDPTALGPIVVHMLVDEILGVGHLHQDQRVGCMDVVAGYCW